MNRNKAKKWSEKRVRQMYQEITHTLIEQKKTITAMESATSGQIASLITDTEGASAVLKGAFVTYSNEAKILQGVSAHTIQTYGVYSMETAREMALAAQKAYRADFAIGVTGTMGNVDPENNDSVPGQVYFAIAHGEYVDTFARELAPQPTRLKYKLCVAGEVGEVLLKHLKGEERGNET